MRHFFSIFTMFWTWLGEEATALHKQDPCQGKLKIKDNCNNKKDQNIPLSCQGHKFCHSFMCAIN